jgi:hypothetical protein
MPCSAVATSGCLIPLPLHPQDPNVPEIQNPIPDDGLVELHPFDTNRTITASLFDRDTAASDLVVIWSVGGDENITWMSDQIEVDPHRLSVWLDLDYDELADHDQDTIELWVSDDEDETTATWLLTVLGDS